MASAKQRTILMRVRIAENAIQAATVNELPLTFEKDWKMNLKSIGYWLTTILFGVAMGFGGFADLIQNPTVMEGMRKLGYPDYFAAIIGFWKIAGVVVLLIPGWRHLKEWAYAGFFFDLTGASASHLMISDPMPEPIIPLVVLAIGMISWYLRPESRCFEPHPTKERDVV